MTRRATFVPADADPAGMLGTTEVDVESVWPDFAPDIRDDIARARTVAIFVGILALSALLFGGGVFAGWLMWGQA